MNTITKLLGLTSIGLSAFMLLGCDVNYVDNPSGAYYGAPRSRIAPPPPAVVTTPGPMASGAHYGAPEPVSNVIAITSPMERHHHRHHHGAPVPTVTANNNPPVPVVNRNAGPAAPLPSIAANNAPPVPAVRGPEAQAPGAPLPVVTNKDKNRLTADNDVPPTPAITSEGGPQTVLASSVSPEVPAVSTNS